MYFHGDKFNWEQQRVRKKKEKKLKYRKKLKSADLKPTWTKPAILKYSAKVRYKQAATLWRKF